MESSSMKKATTFIDGELSSDKHEAGMFLKKKKKNEAGKYMFKNDRIRKIVIILFYFFDKDSHYLKNTIIWKKKRINVIFLNGWIILIYGIC